MQTSQKRQCWECLRRRLVCDSSRPVCNKCQASGVACPGYDDKKPLKWLTPGKVTSRTRRRQGPTIGKDTVSKGTKGETNGLALAERNGVGAISRIELRTETCAIVEAAHYYNTCVYPDLAIHQLAPNPYTALFPLASLPHLPTSMCHTLVCLALGHRIHQLPQRTGHGSMDTWLRLYHHRGVAIQALSEEIGNERTRSSDATFASVLVLLSAELRQSTSSNWRHHVQAVAKLIMLRGGFVKFFRSASHLRPMLLYFIIVGVIGNTTSPPSDQFTAISHPDLLDLILQLYGESPFPTVLCPPSLFLDIISVNRLRFRETTSSLKNEIEADELLKHINAFVPEQWSESSASSRKELLLIGCIYQSAVALYCISSLHSLSTPPLTPQLKAMRTAHRDRLFSLLKKAMVSHQVKKCMMWPLVVAGVEAVDSSAAMCTFVDEHLAEMSRDQGTYLPLLAKAVLKRFWASGKTGWNDCFDGPYAFVA